MISLRLTNEDKKLRIKRKDRHHSRGRQGEMLEGRGSGKTCVALLRTGQVMIGQT